MRKVSDAVLSISSLKVLRWKVVGQTILSKGGWRALAWTGLSPKDTCVLLRLRRRRLPFPHCGLLQLDQDLGGGGDGRTDDTPGSPK